MISVSVSAMASLMRTGILVSPNPGNSITIAPMRANTSMKAAASAGSREMSIRMMACVTPRMFREGVPPSGEGGVAPARGPQHAPPADDSRRDPHHVAVQRVRHERQRQQQRDE